MNAGLLFLLGGLGFGFARSFQLVFVEYRVFHALMQLLEEIIELVHLQLASALTALAAQCGNRHQHHQNGHNQGDCLGQKADVLCKKLHVFPLVPMAAHVHRPR